MRYFEKLQQVAEDVERAEAMAPYGSYEHERFVRAALYRNWPAIRAFIEMNSENKTGSGLSHRGLGFSVALPVADELTSDFKDL